MKRIVLLMVSLSLSLLLWAVPSDTCKIKVEKNVNGLGVYAASNNVYVRNGNISDKKNYVFVTDTIVEIICNDSVVIKLQGGHQEGKVTCWSQVDGKNAQQDKDSEHELAPKKRRNWLKFNSMDISTQVNMSVVDAEGNKIKIDIRKCCGWAGKQLSLGYEISGTNYTERSFKMQGDSLIVPAIKLNKDDRLLKLTFSRSGNKRNMVVNKVLIDGNETPFTVIYDQTKRSETDDIMYDTNIVVDSLLNRQLPGGSHILSYVCTVLTQEGPKDIIAYLPIDVEESPFSFYKLGLFFGGIVLFIVVLFVVVKRWMSRSIAHIKIERLIKKKSDIVEFKADLNFHKQYENLQCECSKFLFDIELPLEDVVNNYLNTFEQVKKKHSVKVVEEYIVNFDVDTKSKFLCYNIEKKVSKANKISDSKCKKIIYDAVIDKVLKLDDVFIPSEIKKIESLIDNSFPNMVMNYPLFTIEYIKNGVNNKKEYNISQSIEIFNEQLKKICGFISDNEGEGMEKTSQDDITNGNEKQNGISAPKETDDEDTRNLMQDEEIFLLLKSQFETEDKNEIIQKLTKQKELKTEVVSSIINQWNEAHPENVVDKSQMNIDSLLRTISNGYICKTGKSQLEKYFDEYEVVYNKETISETIIRGLHDSIYNKGLQVGASSIQRTSKPDNNQVQELSIEKTKLEGIIKNLNNDKNKLQTAMEKLKGDYKTLEDDNIRQIGTVEEQGKEIAELKEKVNAQSQEHVAELDRTIVQLEDKLAHVQNIISDKEQEIATEKKNVENIKMKKAELESKYNNVKTQLDEVEKNHLAAMNKLKDENRDAKLKQKDKYESQILEIKAEMVQKQEAHMAALDKQKSDYEGKLSQQHEKAEKAMQQLKDKQANEISQLNASHQDEVNKLNATIKELGITVNVGRDDMIKNSENLLAAISADLAQIDKSVNAVVNQLPIFVNSINNILTEVQRTCEEFNEAKAADWSKPDKSQAQVMEDMQDIFIYALNRTGWMNNVARLLSYSRLPKLHDGFDLPAELEAHGISTAVLERVYSNMVGLLGIVDMGILVPAVLANDFDKDNYEYKNGDTWIDRFFPEVSTRNYKGKVFDIVQVGYTIDGVTEKKPVVQYN